MAGYEIAYNGDLGEDLKGALIVYLASGSNPITEEEWATYVPPEGYRLNTPRGTYFNELHVLGSPYVPTGEMTYITTSDDYTWESVAALQRSVYPYVPITIHGQTLSPQEIAYSMSTPPDGMVLVDSNDKNHDNVYYGINGAHASEARLQYFIRDAWGNDYILKSVNAANDTPELVAKAVEDAGLPPGWTKLAPYYFLNDVVYSPSYSGENNSIAHANEFRDSADSAWMQVTWAENGLTLDAMAAGGLPIWAGQLGGKLMGSANNDLMYGAQGNDLLRGGKGDDQIDGGAGLNHSIYNGSVNEYEISNTADGLIVADKVSGRDGSDTLLRVQRLDFQDQTMAYDLGAGQHAGEAYRLYEVFGRTPDEQGLGYWVNALDNGTSLKAVAQGFIGSAEFTGLYGSNMTNAQFVAQLYDQLLHRAADPSGEAFWIGALNAGASRADVLAGFSESAENVAQMAPLTLTGVTYYPVIPPLPPLPY